MISVEFLQAKHNLDDVRYLDGLNDDEKYIVNLISEFSFHKYNNEFGLQIKYFDSFDLLTNFIMQKALQSKINKSKQYILYCVFNTDKDFKLCKKSEHFTNDFEVVFSNGKKLRVGATSNFS